VKKFVVIHETVLTPASLTLIEEVGEKAFTFSAEVELHCFLEIRDAHSDHSSWAKDAITVSQ
jgi:hypothetical protein